MKKETIGKLILGVFLISFIYLQYIVFDRVIKQPNNLTEIQGVIDNYQKIKILKKYGFDYAYALKLKNESTRFAIHEKNVRAFNFISNNNIQNKKVKILYDKDGYNSSFDLTYHIYSLEIDDQQILDIVESKQTDKIGLFILFFFDIVIVAIIFYARTLKKKAKHLSKTIKKRIL